MFRNLIITAGLLWALPLTASAQTYTAAEQEVLDQLAECWDIWMEGVRSGSPDRWYTQCAAPELTYWPAQDGAPIQSDFDRRNWDLASSMDLGWVDIRPLSLTVVDNIAVLHFYGYWKTPSEDGQRVTEAKRTEVFRRIDGRWKLMVGHSTPVSMEDASAYRLIKK